jgi:prophage antirepressor-like protein
MEIIKNGKFEISYLTIKDAPWFKAKEMAHILGYGNTRQAIIDHVKIKNKSKYMTLLGSRDSIPLENVQPETIFINEAGLYSLILRSKLKSAVEFQDWITSDVLPSIRKTGTYVYKPKERIKRNHVLSITNETELHYAVTAYIHERMKKKNKNLMLIAGLGEMQDSSEKRIDAYRKGYSSGQPDLLILNKTYKYDGFAIELKSVTGLGIVSPSQEYMLKKFQELKYKVLISNDFAEIITKINSYINKIRLPCIYCNKRFKNKKTLANHLNFFHKIST